MNLRSGPRFAFTEVIRRVMCSSVYISPHDDMTRELILDLYTNNDVATLNEIASYTNMERPRKFSERFWDASAFRAHANRARSSQFTKEGHILPLRRTSFFDAHEQAETARKFEQVLPQLRQGEEDAQPEWPSAAQSARAESPNDIDAEFRSVRHDSFSSPTSGRTMRRSFSAGEIDWPVARPSILERQRTG